MQGVAAGIRKIRHLEFDDLRVGGHCQKYGVSKKANQKWV